MALLRFSVYELDSSVGGLTRSGRRVPIARQPFKVLWQLASRAGEVVSREELRRVLWSDGTHVDFDRGLNFCVAEVRRALGDEARRPRFIETLPRIGYRFLADVHGLAPENLTDPVVTAESRAVCAGAGHAVPSPTVISRPRWRLARLAAAIALPFLVAQAPDVVRARTRVTTPPEALAAFERGDYEDALRLDPRFAEAHYALAERYASRAERRALPPRVAFAKAVASAARAIALEEAPESRRLLGSLRLVVDWDWDGARRELTRALDLAPDWDIGLAAFADLLSASGDDAGALASIARAQALSPGCELWRLQSALFHFRARRYETALEELARARALGPPRDRPERAWQEALHDLSLMIHTQRQDWTAARDEAIALAQLQTSPAVMTLRLATMAPREAVMAFLEASADAMRPAVIRGEASPSRLALLNALQGRTDEALAWLEWSVHHRDAELVFVLRAPAWDSLRADRRFQRIASRVL